LDTATVLAVAAASTAITAENHSMIGGLGSAVAETLAEAGLARPLHRAGIPDTFAEGAHRALPRLEIRPNKAAPSKYGLVPAASPRTPSSRLCPSGRPPVLPRARPVELGAAADEPLPLVRAPGRAESGHGVHDRDVLADPGRAGGGPDRGRGGRHPRRPRPADPLPPADQLYVAGTRLFTGAGLPAG
jgi:hypothetical protein